MIMVVARFLCCAFDSPSHPCRAFYQSSSAQALQAQMLLYCFPSHSIVWHTIPHFAVTTPAAAASLLANLEKSRSWSNSRNKILNACKVSYSYCHSRRTTKLLSSNLFWCIYLIFFCLPIILNESNFIR